MHPAVQGLHDIMNINRGLITAVVALGVAVVVLLTYRSSQQLRSENRDLRGQLERLAQSAVPNVSNPPPSSTTERAARLPESQYMELLRLRGQVAVLRRQLDQQTASGRLPEDQFSELLRLRGQVEVLRQQLEQQTAAGRAMRRMIDEAARKEAPSAGDSKRESTPESTRDAMAWMDVEKAKTQQQLETAEQALATMNVPREIAEMDSAQVLSNTNLSAYWPYFELTRKRDVAEALLKNLAKSTQELNNLLSNPSAP